MSSHGKEEPKKELPQIITDTTSGRTYYRGKFLGKGGFAKCYELTESVSKTVYAGKIVSKSLLLKPHQKEKMSQEIAIHRSLNHQHIVGFHCFFEDQDNVYVILELCKRRSLMELHKRRKALTEPETRYFMRHLLHGVKHLHDKRVIHRDLKLGNLFLNDDMQVKIGDFGLATRVDFDGERKKTLCGTPNYIAPEILNKKGHSFEVDIWSMGCILYTLLVGKPPFETQTLKDTYQRIKKNEYHVPSRVSPSAKSLIQRLLHADPSLRPSAQQILDDEFMVSGYIPTRLPTSCLTMAPRFDARHNVPTRKPLIELNTKGRNIHYIERNLTEHYHTLTVFPQSLYKKVTLLRYFRNYMNEHLLKAGAAMCPREGDELARIPSLRTYFRTRSAIVLHLTNGTLQMNFFEDHTKIILCPLMGAVTYIDQQRNFRTFKLALIQEHGCSADLASRLKYARNMIQKMVTSRSHADSAASSAAAAAAASASASRSVKSTGPMA
ncbi:serine/threonine-protein kinase PLK1 [Hyalella azteca]|uniref:Serine/threonine-protein kinase PLK n=1 Tax=Hyalella azteca TaxID=294128 RepID=A0A8B7NR64_HYAAZ|nr:serine/threonine-protein kinase PLK1 [Hyalella azteca]